MKMKGEDDHLEAMERGREQILPLTALKRDRPCPHLALRLPGSETARRYVGVVCVVAAARSVVFCYRAPNKRKHVL